MAIEQFVNAGNTTLNGTITSGATTLVVAAAAAFPAGPNFRLLVESELMLVTAVSGTTFTVTRGVESTTAAAHTSGVAVAFVVTKASNDQHHADRVIRTTYANRPSAGIAGRIWFSDKLYQAYDDGSNWNTTCLGYQVTEPPAVGGFSWVNQGSSTADQTEGSILLTAANAGSNSARLLVKTAPATPYTITMMMALTVKPNTSNYPQGGLIFRNSSSGKFTMFSPQCRNSSTLNWDVVYWTDATTANSDLFVPGGAYIGNPIWLIIKDDGANRLYSISHDGTNFLQIYSEGRTANFTADQYGFGANASTDPTPVLMNVLSLKVS